ncbi:rhomboid family intramembrane serine protease [Lewinellaceae bacterium SD302]|nr:rhomboid family intramembrane serine protease [Lewinellaceae bacterium SD302]
MQQSVIATLIMIITGLTTWQGERSEEYKEKYLFWTDGILKYGERYRLFSHGMLHSGWIHYGFNMIALLSFGQLIELLYGKLFLLALYVLSLVGGGVYALYVHRNHGDYRAVGASGAVSGVLGASLLADPNGVISLILIPIEFKAWVFGMIYIILTIFALKRSIGNIGHSAHLGGTLAGMLIMLLWQPTILIDHPIITLLLLTPVLYFTVLIYRNPNVLLLDDYWGELFRWSGNLNAKDTPRSPENVDDVLDKINKKGIKSLTDREREILRRHMGE